MNQAIDQLVRQQALVTVFRGFAGAENVHGYLLGSSERLLLLHELTEFHLDGYRLLDRADVERIQFGRFEKYRAAILRAEKQAQNVGLGEPIDIDDWEKAFRSLRKVGRNVIVEGERPGTDLFVIGHIERVNKKSAAVRHFDGLGKWEADPRRIAFADVTSATFDNEYVTVFTKYLRDG